MPARGRARAHRAAKQVPRVVVTQALRVRAPRTEGPTAAERRTAGPSSEARRMAGLRRPAALAALTMRAAAARWALPTPATVRATPTARTQNASSSHREGFVHAKSSCHWPRSAVWATHAAQMTLPRRARRGAAWPVPQRRAAVLRKRCGISVRLRRAPRALGARTTAPARRPVRWTAKRPCAWLVRVAWTKNAQQPKVASASQ